MADTDGTSKRQHLLKVVEEAPEGSELYESALAELDESPTIPFYLEHIWEWFWQISRGRSGGLSGPNPLTWQDIKSWKDLLEIQIRPIEIEILYEIDSVYLKFISDKQKTKTAIPSEKGPTPKRK